MKIKSIRWRLSISFAAIALLAALLLGVILVWILFSFYSRQERDYLTWNADSVGVILTHAAQNELPEENLQHLAESIAFISNTQVRLLAQDKSVLIDSGPPEDRTTIAFEGFPRNELPISGDEAGFSVYFSDSVDFQDTGEGAPPVDVVIGDAPLIIEAVDAGPIGGWAIAAPVGDITLPGEPQWNGPRSMQIVQRPYYDEAGALQGYVELSSGPAYGREILKSVVVGWLISGSFAVILAALTGWLLSQRFSAPLTALAEVTSQMTDGDLSARADASQGDEYGLLANSFNHMAESVESKVETMQRFVADAAHELYTPLSALRGSLELVEIEGITTKQLEHIRQAQAQVSRMYALTKGLLDLSLLETDEASLQFTQVDLSELLTPLSEPFASRAEQAGIEFTLDMYETTPIVLGDATQIRILVSNLLDNAIKFTTEGGRVSVVVLSDGDMVLLSVKDTGIGISEEDRPKLFSRFHRGRNATAFPGSGLGLAIAKTIADLHQAILDVKSSEDGTQIDVSFPMIR